MMAGLVWKAIVGGVCPLRLVSSMRSACWEARKTQGLLAGARMAVRNVQGSSGSATTPAGYKGMIHYPRTRVVGSGT
jgi:hypothetical protein